MSSRTTKFAAAGLLVVVLPLSSAATATAQARTTFRTHGSTADASSLLDAVGTSGRYLARLDPERRRSSDTSRDDELDGADLDTVGSPGESATTDSLASATHTLLPQFVVHAANLSADTDDATREALQADIQDAVDSARLAVARAHDSLAQVAVARNVVARRFAATELADAEVGLAAATAHLRYTVHQVSQAGSPEAAQALEELTSSIDSLHQTVIDVNV